MKKLMWGVLFALVVSVFGTWQLASASGLVLGIKPNQPWGSGSLGWEFGNLTVAGSADYFTTSFHLDIKDSEGETAIDLSGSALAPSMSLQLLLGSAGAGKTVPYVTGSYGTLKPKVSVNAEYQGETAPNIEEINKQIEDFFAALKINLYTLAIGGEYYATDNFSVIGEYGLRFATVNYSKEFPITNQDEYGNDYPDILRVKVSRPISVSYTSLGVRYHF